ncbi:MAG TPA: hypothetical protein VGG75_20225 [Trebonia sp.]
MRSGDLQLEPRIPAATWESCLPRRSLCGTRRTTRASSDVAVQLTGVIGAIAGIGVGGFGAAFSFLMAVFAVGALAGFLLHRARY